MKPRNLLSTILLVGLLSAGLRAPEQSTSRPALPDLPRFEGVDFSRNQSVIVSRVVDGGVIDVLLPGKGSTGVRLIGVDAGQTMDPNGPGARFGEEASAFLKGLLRNERVYLLNDGEEAKAVGSGRRLAYVVRASDRLFVNAEIVRRGYGRAYTAYPFRFKDEFCSLERFAREGRLGLWAPEVARARRGDPSAGASKSPALSEGAGEAGEVAAGGPLKTAPGATTVYGTRTGSKYHTDGCRFLGKSKVPVSLDVAIARGLTPCSACQPPVLATSEAARGDDGHPVAENGSRYGEVSKETGRPKTTYVGGYYRKDGTYVRGHYRSSRR